jgi:hypothetical protein
MLKIIALENAHFCYAQFFTFYFSSNIDHFEPSETEKENVICKFVIYPANVSIFLNGHFSLISPDAAF